jgi:hypothetical protein
MSHSCIKNRLTPLTFLLCIRRKLRLPIYPNRTPCTCGHHEHDISGDHAFSCERGSKKRALNIIVMDFARALSTALAQAGYLFPITPMAVKPLFHLRSDSTARPFGYFILSPPNIIPPPPKGETGEARQGYHVNQLANESGHTSSWSGTLSFQGSSIIPWTYQGGKAQIKLP